MPDSGTNSPGPSTIEIEYSQGSNAEPVFLKDREMAKRKKIPEIIEELARVIEAGLDKFPAEERKARLDRIHVILTGAGESRRGTSPKRPRKRTKLRPSRPRVVRA